MQETPIDPDGMLRPILVFGLTRRVGTNYLGRLLATHRECTAPRTLHEDFLVSGLSHLENYIRSVQANWNEAWGAHDRIPDLRGMLGHAVLSFMQSDADEEGRRVVFKSPAVSGLELAPTYLPGCDLIVLTRFGPDVVESGMKGFNWEFDDACRRWGAAAAYLVALQETFGRSAERVLKVVRYEDLVAEPKTVLRSIFTHAGLDASAFDYASVEDFPVYGSSFERGGADDLHWSPVARPQAFDPTSRSEHWSREAYQRFDQITKSVSKRLGYDLPL